MSEDIEGDNTIARMEFTDKWIDNESSIEVIGFSRFGSSEPNPKDKICEKSPDKKYHYSSDCSQHAMMYHSCYECVFCGHGRCENHMPEHMFNDDAKLKLPTDDDFDRKQRPC